MPPTSLTTHLLTLTPSSFTHATQNPFLENAGRGTLGKDVLGGWLARDRLYAQAYVRFAAGLIARVELPVGVDGGEWGNVDLLLDALNNVRRELKFFEDVAARYGFDLDVCVREGEGGGVAGYKRLFEDVGRKGVLEGMVLLWGTEKCYLEAWRYAATFLPPESEAGGATDGGALRKEFIPNWTGDEFVVFVEKIEALTEEMWKGNEEGVEMEALEGVWREVLKVEE
ncbi:hypothetical protein LOCC1_G006143, partial [Lachnellula occidentalis]